ADALVPLYSSAVDVLVALHQHPAGAWRAYDLAELQREAGLLVDWFCPAIEIDVDANGYRAAWDEVLHHALTDRPVTVLRD
ncbi:MAG: aminoglycoside phosphotransferase, partial [Xanthomonas perforans]|nr:aminoglycoside phosphotransferase [Xanthomonas perforans]